MWSSKKSAKSQQHHKNSEKPASENAEDNKYLIKEQVCEELKKTKIKQIRQTRISSGS